MATLAIALPCLPGGGEKLRNLAKECEARTGEFDDFHRRTGLTSESWHLQTNPDGRQLAIIVLDGDPGGAIAKLGASDHPFDVWFRDAVKEVHGVDFAKPLPGPPPELVFESETAGVTV